MEALPPGMRVCKSSRCSSAPQPLCNFSIRKKDSANGKKGQLTDICNACMAQDRDKKRKRAAKIRGDENILPKHENWEDILMDEFLENLTMARNSDIEFRVRVDTEDFVSLEESPGERARAIAMLMSDVMGLHWTFRVHHVRSDWTEFEFNCAQSIDIIKKWKTREGAKARAQRKMERGECKGFLRIQARPDSLYMNIAVHHVHSHAPYEDISLPEKWKEFIRNNLKMTPAQIWREILSEVGDKDISDVHVPFRQKAVYYYWNQQVQEQWRFEDDPFESAQKYLAETAANSSIQPLDIIAPAGTRALAFYITDFAREWAKYTQELALDSTWQTNGQNFELFAAVADANGIGLPLSYLMVSTTQLASQGCKEAILTSWLTGLKGLGINPEFILTDKDQSEINAVGRVWPDSKHQLCFWHALRAVKQRLAKNKTTPGFYDANAANKLFNFIDTSFVPQSQYNVNSSREGPPEKPIQRIVFLFNNRPQVLTHARSAKDTTGSDNSDSETHWSHQDSDDNDMEGYNSDSADLLELVTKFDSQKCHENIHEPSLPEESGPKPNDTSYQFCPPAHRLSILRLFTKHHAQHPLLPERHGQRRTAEQIYSDAVMEMYTHCTRNNLYEVWAYLWNSWYSPAKWKLWARSAHPSAIPRKRTTMLVEALWKNLKRITLHLNNRPRLDFTIHLIITQSIPAYRVSFANVTARLRGSRPHNLTPEQRAFKSSWLKLTTRTLQGTYETNVDNWTCSCGAQKYQTHLLCKHLVQKVNVPSSNWWPTVFRAHTVPFYRVPGTRSENVPLPQLTPYSWLARMPGTFVPLPKTPLKKPLGDSTKVNELVAPSQLHTTPGFSSSPSQPAAPLTANAFTLNGLTDGLMHTETEDDFDRLDNVLKSASAILHSQGKQNIDPRFLATFKAHCQGLQSLVADVQAHEQRHTMPLTNGKHGLVKKNLVGYRYREKDKENVFSL